MLMDKLAEMIITYATAQVKAGVSAIQIFDSWVGSLNASDYQIYIKPTMNYIFTELRKLNVPLILFGIGARHLLLEFNDLPVDVIGLDWRITIPEARAMGVTKVLNTFVTPIARASGIVMRQSSPITSTGKSLNSSNKCLAPIPNKISGTFNFLSSVKI